MCGFQNCEITVPYFDFILSMWPLMRVTEGMKHLLRVNTLSSFMYLTIFDATLGLDSFKIYVGLIIQKGMPLPSVP